MENVHLLKRVNMKIQYNWIGFIDENPHVYILVAKEKLIVNRNNIYLECFL